MANPASIQDMKRVRSLEAILRTLNRPLMRMGTGRIPSNGDNQAVMLRSSSTGLCMGHSNRTPQQLHSQQQWQYNLWT